MVFRVFFFICFRTNGKKEHLDENNFRHVDVNYFEKAILKVTWYLKEYWWYQLCQIGFLTFTGYSGNGIWKTLCCWRFYGNGSTYVLIFSWVNLMKQKWVKVPRKLSVVQMPEHILWRTFHLLLYSFSLKQT